MKPQHDSAAGLPHSTPGEPIAADLGGRVAVVTGATAGIGREAAAQLAALGARVVLVARTQAKADAVRDELAGRGLDRDLLETGVAELSRIPDVVALGDDLAARFPRLDVLVNNAGAYPPGLSLTPEDVESSWATNVLAYHVLTERLAGPLRAARGRVIMVGSTMAGGLDLGDLRWERRRFGGMRAYSQTKQADRMLGWIWDGRLAAEGVTVNVAHPDGTASNIAHAQKGLYGVLARLAFRTQRSPAESADTITWLAAAPELDGVSRRFWHDRAPIVCEWRDDAEGLAALDAAVREQVSPYVRT